MQMNPLKHGRGVLAIATLALCVLGPSVVRGAESDTEKKQRAKEHYEIATRFYDVGKYGEAVKEYEEAYMLTGDAALLFNIGQAYRLWDRPEDAIRVYKNYLRQRPDDRRAAGEDIPGSGAGADRDHGLGPGDLCPDVAQSILGAQGQGPGDEEDVRVLGGSLSEGAHLLGIVAGTQAGRGLDVAAVARPGIQTVDPGGFPARGGQQSIKKAWHIRSLREPSGQPAGEESQQYHENHQSQEDRRREPRLPSGI